MSFFKNLFKRKAGGTFVGNLLRGVANKATKGKLGNGDDLRRWEEKQGINSNASTDSYAYSLGRKAGEPLERHVDSMGDNPAVKDFENRQIMNTLKKWWWAIALGVATVIGITYKLAKK